MKYMVQIYGNVTREQVAAMSDDERNELYAAWGAIRSTPGPSVRRAARVPTTSPGRPT